jgi:hypothetical protein
MEKFVASANGVKILHQERIMATNRRDVLTRGLALLGAAVGIGVAGNKSTEADGQPEISQEKQFVLHVRHLRISSQDLQKGQLPIPGVRMLAKAEVVSAPSNGQKVGDFFASYVRINAPGKVADHEPGSFEDHTFVLPDGNIFGKGVAPSGMDREGQFAIVGGTGRYLGAKGSYIARQSHVDFGGNGSATFTLTLL